MGERDEICVVYSNTASGISAICFAKFRKGEFDLDDQPKSGRSQGAAETAG